MIQIGNIFISLDLLEKRFICDLPACKGYCCVEGDAGAPLNDEETTILEKEYSKFDDFITDKGRTTISKTGKWVYDLGREKVTPLIDGKECAYSFVEGYIYKCAIEQAWHEGKTLFRKPVSCHLYPIRMSNIGTGIALNFHSWAVCQPALIHGNGKGIPVYKFLEEAIIRVFGKDFYNELDEIADKWTIDHGQWTMDHGQWTIEKDNSTNPIHQIIKMEKLMHQMRRIFNAD